MFFIVYRVFVYGGAVLDFSLFTRLLSCIEAGYLENSISL